MDRHAYTIAEAAKLGGISRTKVYEEISAKRLLARKVGSRTIILASDFQRFLEALPPVRKSEA
jgi:excisionase family DNA binding protein